MTIRYLAIQVGARRNYVVPRILEEAGVLEGFFTDACNLVGMTSLLHKIVPTRLRKGAIARLLRREPPASLRDRTYHAESAVLRMLLRQACRVSDPFQRQDAFGLEFDKAFLGLPLDRYTHVFSMGGEGRRVLEKAHGLGCRVAVETYITPRAWSIVDREASEFPELSDRVPRSEMEGQDQHWQRLQRIANRFIVPSDFVAEGLADYGVEMSRVARIPYDFDASFVQGRPSPTPRRVLFVGTAEIRKGVHYLGMAAARLKSRNIEFRVVGPASTRIIQSNHCRELQFVGQVPRWWVHEEFKQADIFVLPTLAEGSASSVYEAMACGLPVVTTPAAGSIVRDGVDGYIVPVRDPDTLADRIERIIEDRALRDRLGENARAHVAEYSFSHYSRRLLEVLCEE